MRIAEKFRLADIGLKDEYIRRHREIWPEMKTVIKKAGIRNYTIWLSGTDIFAYYEVRDPEQCKKVLKRSDVKARWDAYMKDIICFENNEDSPTQLECCFLLE